MPFNNRKPCKVGDKFHKLTIIKTWLDYYNGKSKRESLCECVCDCGSEKSVIVPLAYLKNNHKKSCGCMQVKNNKDHHTWTGCGEISGTMWASIKKGAYRRSRELDFNITIEDAWKQFEKQGGICAISGVEIKFSIKNKQLNAEQNTASLDRIDSNKGYTIDNIQWLHKNVNIMKMHLSQEEFIKWSNLVANYR